MSIYILTILKQADDPYYPKYEYIRGAYSTREQAEEAAMNLQNKHESILHSDFYVFSGWRITKCEVNSDTGNTKIISRYYRE